MINYWYVIPLLLGIVYPPIFILFSLAMLPKFLSFFVDNIPEVKQSKLYGIFHTGILILMLIFYVINIFYLIRIDFDATNYYRDIWELDFWGAITELFKNYILLFSDIENLSHDLAMGNCEDNLLVILLVISFLFAIVIYVFILIRPVLRVIFRFLSNFFKYLSEDI